MLVSDVPVGACRLLALASRVQASTQWQIAHHGYAVALAPHMGICNQAMARVCQSDALLV